MGGTIKEIAEAAGVSTATVSRVLNSSPQVRPKTRERVEEAIRRLNYSPSALARGLARKRTNLLGLILSDITNPFYPELIRGIQDRAKCDGYHVIICNTDGKYSQEERYLWALLELRVEGVIFASVLMSETRGVELVRRAGIPLVLVNRRLPDTDLDYVVVDNKQGAMQAVRYLVGLGHRQIGIIAGPGDASNSAERLAGYVQALEECGIALRDDYIITTEFSRRAAFEATKEMMTLADPPTALFVVNDNMAVGTLGALSSLGLQVPGDVAVVGFDDTEMASLEVVNLTTVSHRCYTMGSEAVNILMDRIKGTGDAKPRQIVLKPELKIRKTCGPCTKRYDR